MPSIQPPREPLGDDRVALRLAAERDIPEILIAYQDDPDLHVRLGEERPPSGAQLGRLMEQTETDLGDGTAVRLTILQAGSDDCRGQVIAHASIGRTPVPTSGSGWRLRSVARGWRAAPCCWRRGGFSTRVGSSGSRCLPQPDNEPVLRSARAAGFVDEGVLRQYAREQGKRVDIAVLSVIPGDMR